MFLWFEAHNVSQPPLLEGSVLLSNCLWLIGQILALIVNRIEA